MAPILSKLPAIGLTLLCALIFTNAAKTPPAPYKFCKKYFGYMGAELQLADTVAEYNYNGTILCPHEIIMQRVPGATLQICPPWEQDEGQTLTATLRLSPSGILDLPIDGVDLQVSEITNGSFSGPFKNGGTPAILQFDAARSQPQLEYWTINGTERSLVDEPSSTNTGLGAFFSCNNVKDPYYYCGTYSDLHTPPDSGRGCWAQQQFYFNMANALNFTFRFSDHEASVEIWAESEYILYDGTPTGSSSRAYMKFVGDDSLPSIVDYDFWRNADLNYETEKADLTDIYLSPDAKGLPLFENRTTYKEWYDSANGTFGVKGKASSVRSSGGLVSLVGCVLGVVCVMSFL